MAGRGRGTTFTKVAQVIVIITCCAAALLIQNWLMTDLHFHPLAAGGATIGVVLAFAGISYVVMRYARKATANDDARTIDPILAAYEESDSKRQLARDYEEWAAGEHGKLVRVQMIERMSMALARHGHAFEARMRADELGALAATDAERASVEKFREELEQVIAEVRGTGADEGEAGEAAPAGQADAAPSPDADADDAADEDKDVDGDTDAE